jgi:hypothetical protein
MASSRYLLQIIDRWTGNTIKLEPGLSKTREPILAEMAFIEDCVTCIVSLGVGIGRTEAHVAKDIRTGIELAILDLKTQIKVPPNPNA